LRPDARAPGARFAGRLRSGALDLLLVHVSEGRRDDPLSRSELGLLEKAGLLTERTAIIHRHCAGSSGFREPGSEEGGHRLVAAQHMELYGQTLDVAAARSAGVRLAISPDWSPTGSDNMLAEMRYAWALSNRKPGGVVSAKDPLHMATASPAAIARKRRSESARSGRGLLDRRVPREG
jgi:hypothetical protein